MHWKYLLKKLKCLPMKGISRLYPGDFFLRASFLEKPAELTDSNVRLQPFEGEILKLSTCLASHRGTSKASCQQGQPHKPTACSI